MEQLALITPSYRRDFDLLLDLRRSVLQFAPQDVTHYVIVPGRDMVLFSELATNRCVIWSEEDLLPRRFVPIPGANVRLNLRYLYPPVRGWIAQQIVKLLAAARVEARSLLVVDSDVVFVRPFSTDTILHDGRVRFYRKDAAVHAGMPQHLEWHRVARQLLGLPARSVEPPLHDYISSFGSWDREVVLALNQRIEQVSGRSWIDTLARQVRFSEFILYGVFVDEILGAPATDFSADTTLCHSYWGVDPLDLDAAMGFMSTIRDEDIAVLIQSESKTPLAVRRQALAEFARR